MAEGMAQGRAEGREEGIAEGLAQGREEGEKQKAIAVARILKSSGTAIELICAATGLSEEEVTQL